MEFVHVEGAAPGPLFVLLGQQAAYEAQGQ